jgi:hypothetical protein
MPLRVRVPVLFLSAGAPAAQSLTPPFLDDADALYAPVVAPGAVALSLPFLADADALFVPTVTLGGAPAQSLSLPFLASSGVLYAPSVSLAEGPAQSLILPPEDRIVMVSALARAARVEGLPRSLAPRAQPRIILIT